ncbi:hypothetical protein Tco_0127930, partial [Tanacetum coccineum]
MLRCGASLKNTPTSIFLLQNVWYSIMDMREISVVLLLLVAAARGAAFQAPFQAGGPKFQEAIFLKFEFLLLMSTVSSSWGGPVPTLPFVTSSVSATPKREDEHLADSVTGLNLQTICDPQRFVISSDSSHHSGANIAEAEVDSIARSAAPIIATVVTTTADVATTTKEAPAREAPGKPSLFAASSSSAGRTDPAPGGFSDVCGSDFLVGGIRTVVDLEFDLQKHDQLFNEFNVGTARQISLSAEVRMCVEYNIKEKRRLKAVVEEKDMLLKTKGEEI